MTDELIPVLRVSDAHRAAAWWEQLGFAVEWEHVFEPGFPVFVALRTASGQALYLSEHRGDAPPEGLVFLRTSDLDRVVAALEVDMQQQPWGRQAEAVDPDGNRVRILDVAG